eukprot:scaffold2659_cov107-Cylindrotheca_fusiformis.AAC.16
MTTHSDEAPSGAAMEKDVPSKERSEYLYVGIGACLCKFLFPSLVTFFATQTPLKSCIRIWLPLFLWTLPAVRSAKSNHTKWLRYWSMHASLEFLARSFHSFFSNSTFLNEVDLFGSCVLLYQTISETEFPSGDSSLSLWSLWEDHVLPSILYCEATVSFLSSEAIEVSSSPIPPDVDSKQGDSISWVQRLRALGHRGSQMLVLFGIVSQERLEWMNAKFRNGNPAIIAPVATLVIPGTSTLGLLYLQWILPASRSLRCKDELYWMKYWIVQGVLLHGVLDYITYQLPYLLQVALMWKSWMLLLWIGIHHEQWVVDTAYAFFESELEGFGLLEASKINEQANMNPLETQTVQFLKEVLKKLPSARILDNAMPPQLENASSSSISDVSFDDSSFRSSEMKKVPAPSVQSRSSRKLFRRRKQVISELKKKSTQ